MPNSSPAAGSMRGWPISSSARTSRWRGRDSRIQAGGHVMKTWKRIAITTSAIVIVAGAGLTVRTMKMAGSFDDVVPRPLACTAIAGVTGAEDMQLDARDRLLFVSAADRRHMGSKADGIYALSVGRPETGFA